MSDSLLPVGLTFERKTENLRVSVNKSEVEGPMFTVEVTRMTREQFQALVARNQLPRGMDPNSKTAKAHDAKFQEAFCRKVIKGWDGLTVANLEDLLPNVTINIDAEEDGADRFTSGGQIPYSHELAVLIYREAWSDSFADKIFIALKDGVGDEADEDEALKE